MRKIIALLFVLVIGMGLHAQEVYNSSGKKGTARYKENKEVSGFDPHRLIFGGGFNAGYGYGALALGVSPVAGYRITDRFSAGIRLGYLYQWIRGNEVYVNGKTGMVEVENGNYHWVAPGVWARFIVWDNLFAHTEFQYNVFTHKDYATSVSEPGYTVRRVVDHAPAWLVGVGYRQPVSDHASIVIEAYYDVLQDIPANQRVDYYGRTYSVSPYADRIDFRIGFNIGF